MMKKNEPNFLVTGLVIGGILGAGLFVFLSSRFISKTKKNRRERKYKFFEGIDDIFDESARDIADEDKSIDKETEAGIIDELFSRTN